MKSYKLRILLVATLVVAGCNVFDPFDTPTNDEQLLSAARACFDRADFECARENYAKLSGNYADVAKMEEMFLQLDQAGIGMKQFMESFGDGNAANGLNNIAGLFSTSATVSKRQAIFGIYNTHKGIVDTNLRAFSRFITSMVLLAEFLAEASGGDGSLNKDDISTVGATCKALDSASCLASAACQAPNSGLLSNGNAAPGDFLNMTSVPVTTPMDLFMVKEAADEVAQALSQLSVSGKFSSGTYSVLNSISIADLSTAQAKNCFRFLILSQGIGN